MEKRVDRKIKKDNNIVAIILSTILLIISIYYGIISIKDMNNHINNTFILINSIMIMISSLFISLSFIFRKKLLNIFTLLILISLVGLNLNIIKFPTQEILGNKIGLNINEVVLWADKNNIDVTYDYENSDLYKVDEIMIQDTLYDTLLRNVKKLHFIVSSGPNTNKGILLTNYVGSSIEEFLKFMNDNYLTNVTINYELNDTIDKDIVIAQNLTGAAFRNSNIVLTVSLGTSDNLVPVALESMKKKTLFEATLYLKRNGIKYDLKYEYSDDIPEGNVISHSPNTNETVDPKTDTVTLILSKGKKIIVPNLLEMSKDKIVEWVLANELKIEFNEKYHDSNIGKIIGANYKENDVIASGTKIIITTSKGPLKLEKYNSLQEFKDWADTYDITYSTLYEFSSSVAKGNIIKLSHPEGTVIDESTSIIVYISQGKAITVPNFVGKSKSNITSTCNSLGIKCSFNYSGYSSTAKDIATKQNIKSGTTVVSGAVVTISLSSGPAKTFTTYISSDWFGTTADATINTLRSKLTAACPGVTFKFNKGSSDIGFAGQIHPSSPTKAGNFSCTQGKTYTFLIIN